MKKNCFFAIILGISVLLTANSYALSISEFRPQNKHKEIIATGFTEYPPFGYSVKNKRGEDILASIFKPILDNMAIDNNWTPTYVLYKDYDRQVLEVKRGNIDVILGAYHDTTLYDGIELVYPAAIINPITVFMLPNRISEVKSTEDLQKLKGVRVKHEVYSNFVEKQLQFYDIESVDTTYELFERLFTKKADYILIGQYYGLIEASKLGVRNQISVARQTLWQMPMFIGVSKLSQYRKMLVQKIANHLNVPANIEEIKQKIIQMVDKAEIDAQGVVPPTFGMEQEQ
ncbi:MAG: hypothetical protein E7019_02510 [Alphaproteobacteria bacterium]|nr:hypothetical protein [Alphaproteobacteria bacterium]